MLTRHLVPVLGPFPSCAASGCNKFQNVFYNKAQVLPCSTCYLPNKAADSSLTSHFRRDFTTVDFSRITNDIYISNSKHSTSRYAKNLTALEGCLNRKIP